MPQKRAPIPSLLLLTFLALAPLSAIASSPGDETETATAARQDASRELATCQRRVSEAYAELARDEPAPGELDDCRRALNEAYAELGKNETRRTRDDAEVMPSMGGAFLHMLLVLGAVCLLAYLLLGKLLPRLMRVQPPTASRRVLEVLDRLPLDQRRSLLVVKIANQYFLVGASEGGISLLSRLDPDEVQGALEASERTKQSIGRLTDLLLPRSQKES